MLLGLLQVLVLLLLEEYGRHLGLQDPGDRRDGAQRLHRALRLPPRSSLSWPGPPGHTRKTSQLSLPTVGMAFSTRCLPKTLKGQESRVRGN